MPWYTGLVTIKRDGKYHPPGTRHELDENEAKALGPSRVRLDENYMPAASAAGLESAGDATGDAPPAQGEAPPAQSEAGGASDSRVAEIMAALDLLDAEKDFLKSGKRAGKPKQKPIEDIVGFDVTEAEIDAALGLRDASV